MENKIYKTGVPCPKDGIYQCQLSQETQRYKKDDIFDYCPLGKETRWKKIE